MKSLLLKAYPYLALAGLAAVLGFSYKYHLPRFKVWAVVQLEEQTKRHLPVRILASNVSFHAFPLGVSLHKLRILPNRELENTLSIAYLEELTVDLNFVQLLSGRLRIQEITFVRPQLALRIETTGDKKQMPTLEEIFNFDQAVGLPIDRITILRANVNAVVAKPELLIRARQFSASLSHSRRSMGLQIIAPYLAIQQREEQTEVSFSSRGGLRLTPDEFQVSDLHIKKGKSILRMNGQIDGDVTKLDFNHFTRPAALKVQALLDIQDLSKWARETFPKIHIPPAEGHLRTDILISQHGKGSAEVSGDIAGRNLAIDGFQIGEVETEGHFQNQLLQLNKLIFRNDAGRVELKGTELTFGETFSVKTEATTNNLNLHHLLRNLRVGDLPLELGISATVPCSGTLHPKLVLKCTPTVEGRDLQVWNGHEREHIIVSAKPLTGTGEMTVTNKEVQYKGKAKSETGEGESSGVINYETGFQIAYKADKFDFKDIRNLADLQLEGQVKVEGTTQGNGHAATFSMDINGNNIWFENYFLGTAGVKLSYKSGLLGFRDVRGQVGSSRYNANVSFNIPERQLLVVGQVPFVDAQDAVTVFSRRVHLPMTVSGTGSAQLKLSGPPRFNALTYNFRSSLFRGTIAGESFEKAVFNVTAERGEVKTDQVVLTKGKGTMVMTGAGHPDGNIDVKMVGQGFRLEDSETINHIGSNIAGDLEFDMSLTGYVLLPDTTLNGHVRQAFIGENPMGDSDFRLKISKNTLEGDGHFMGTMLQSRFIYPLNDEAPFKLNLTTRDFDFTPLVASLVDSTAPRSEFQAALSMQVDLAANRGGFWNSTGSAHISKLVLRRGTLQLANQETASIRFRDGQIDVDKLALEGDGGFFRVTSNRPARKKLDWNVSGKSDLAFLQILTPFLSELRGPVSLTTQVRGDNTGIDFLGTAFLERGLVKIKQFPHAFQNLKSDIVFNQRKIIFNTITGELGGGQLSAEGDLEIKGYRNFPLHLGAHLAGTELNIPEGVRTRGDADLQLSGSWFPYLLRGSYSVRSGLMTREFTDGSSDSAFRQSSYLPKTVKQDVFSPLDFNIDVDIATGFQVRNSMADTPLSGQLIVTGNTQSPQLRGILYPQKGGRVLFRENTEFEITASNIRFLEGKPTNDPALFLTATTRVQSFDINLLVQGTGQRPDIKLSSQPPMTEPEIISLLALGVTPPQYQTDANARNEGKEAVQSGTKIGSALLGDSPIKKEIKNKTGFNVDISSTNPNKAPTFATTDDTVSVPKITVSRQWTPKFGASASRTVGDVQLSDVKFKYQLNRSVSLVGRWETREIDPAASRTTQTTQNAGGLDSSSLFGLDLEYKLEFK